MERHEASREGTELPRAREASVEAARGLTRRPGSGQGPASSSSGDERDCTVKVCDVRPPGAVKVSGVGVDVLFSQERNEGLRRGLCVGAATP